MEAQDNILEFRYFGDNITPSSFKAKELVDIIENLEKAIIATANLSDEDRQDFYISITDISNKSLGLGFLPSRTKLKTAFLALGTAISTQSTIDLPVAAIEPLKALQKHAAKKKCSAQFIDKGEPIATFDANTAIDIPKNLTIKYSTTLYGEIKRAGGAKPKIVFEVLNGNTISLLASKDIAQQAAISLYKVVGLRGTATRNKKTGEVIDFNITAIVDNYNPGNIKSAFDNLRPLLGKYWDKIDDVDTYLNS